VLLVPILGKGAAAEPGKALRIESRVMTVQVDPKTARWSLADKQSGVRWPTTGDAAAGSAPEFAGGFRPADVKDQFLRLQSTDGVAIGFELVDAGRTLEIRYETKSQGEICVGAGVLDITDKDGGYALVPCREGLLVPADSGKSFQRSFGTSDYEGVHMNMLGLVKSGSCLVVTWDDAYVWADLQSKQPKDNSYGQILSASLRMRRTARCVRFTPLGEGDWNTVAAGYRRIAQGKKLASTLADKIAREPHAKLLVGASNAKLWTCLARRRNEQSTKDESVNACWTFDEAAQIAEHLCDDLKIDRCLFVMGGWTEGGYDCRHPDNLPANPECGGNEALARAIHRIQNLGYVACLHDNYQDMYRDAKSWDPDYIEKDAKGNLKKGGRWLGGRAYMVAAPYQLALARREQNLPSIKKRFRPWCYFIDTTYAVGPRESMDPKCPVNRNTDIQWKMKLSDYARDMFGLFGSECGREWALPHSDFFEGNVGVAGRCYHNLKPKALGATVIPLFEMVYHDCQICYGKYGYAMDAADEYVAHHVLCARPLHYHGIPEHLYWRREATDRDMVAVRPRIAKLEPTGKREFRISYVWEVQHDVDRDWRIFVHFCTADEIHFQDDRTPDPPTAAWRKGKPVSIAPRTIRIPSTLQAKVVDVYAGLYNPKGIGTRAKLPGCDSRRRVCLGRLQLSPQIKLLPAPSTEARARGAFLRCDGGWAEVMHPTDVFIKNTHEVLGPLHAATAFQRLTRFEFLSEDGKVRRATYGSGERAVEATVNFGTRDATVKTNLGGQVTLPPLGFVIEGPSLVAFYAKKWGGQIYADGALFTIRPLQTECLAEARKIKIFHGFGDPTIVWQGKTHTVHREKTINPTPATGGS